MQREGLDSYQITGVLASLAAEEHLTVALSHSAWLRGCSARLSMEETGSRVRPSDSDEAVRKRSVDAWSHLFSGTSPGDGLKRAGQARRTDALPKKACAAREALRVKHEAEHRAMMFFIGRTPYLSDARKVSTVVPVKAYPLTA